MNCDCAGESGSFDDLMLASVEPRCRPAPQLEANTEDPNGLVFNAFALCGNEPARIRDKNVEALVAPTFESG